MIKKIIIIFSLLSMNMSLAQNSAIDELNLSPLSSDDVESYRNIFDEQNRSISKCR